MLYVQLNRGAIGFLDALDLGLALKVYSGFWETMLTCYITSRLLGVQPTMPYDEKPIQAPS